MRHFLIDTDTASDDAVALLMALREPSVRVEAITVVAGNCPLVTCITNALICVEKARRYQPPVYAGMDRPMLRPLMTSEFVHGEDGMGNMALPAPDLHAAETHGVDAIIETARRFAGELEVVALGPLTNLAMALLKEPRLAGWIKRLYIMGGAGLGPGNITPVAEFNFFVDAEAAQVVMSSSVAKTVVGWDVCMDESFINQADIARLNGLGPLGQFAVRCNASLIEFNKGWNKDGFDLPDPTTMAVALFPSIVTREFDAHGLVEYKSEQCYGQFVIDRHKLTGQADNVSIVTEINPADFKQLLFRLLAASND